MLEVCQGRVREDSKQCPSEVYGESNKKSDVMLQFSGSRISRPDITLNTIGSFASRDAFVFAPLGKFCLLC